jgi:hypothetical protein
MSKKKYIIKIYNKDEDSLATWGKSHFFGGRNNSEDNNYLSKSYYPREEAGRAIKLTKEQSIKAIKEIEFLYEINPENGQLSKIRILDADTLKVVNLNNIEKFAEEINRFELIDFD